jgi:hypothetical protein
MLQCICGQVTFVTKQNVAKILQYQLHIDVSFVSTTALKIRFRRNTIDVAEERYVSLLHCSTFGSPRSQGERGDDRYLAQDKTHSTELERTVHRIREVVPGVIFALPTPGLPVDPTKGASNVSLSQSDYENQRVLRRLATG